MVVVKVFRTWPQFRALVNKMLIVEQGKMGITGFCALTLNDLADVDFWDYYPGNEGMSEEDWRKAASEAALHVLEEQDGFSFLMD